MSHRAVDLAFAIRLPHLQKNVLMALAYRHNHVTGQCDPAVETIAQDCGMSKSSVKTALRSLCVLGLISATQRKSGQVHISNFYTLNFLVGVGQDTTGVGQDTPHLGQDTPEGRAPDALGVGQDTPPKGEVESGIESGNERKTTPSGVKVGYAVQKSKKWRRNQASASSSNDQMPDLADNREPSQESANLPRGNTVDPRGNALYPRGNPLPIRKTVQDNTKQTTPETVLSDEAKTAKTKTTTRKLSIDDIDRVYQAYPLKKEPGAARIAISKAFGLLTQRGENDPATFLLGRIEAMKAARDRDNAAGRFAPQYKYPASWFDKECYDEESIQPVKNCVLPSGMLGTESELAQTGWAVIRGEV